jgi:DNA modification methylase
LQEKREMTYQILHGNNLDILPTLADNSIDSIVTDPPYELGFMGKKWDSSGIAYSVELWQQCLRVLKPGGHLLAFSGSRTYHRMVVAIEDAGFEIRDMISWISNKTFPKSLDIAKAIDKGQGQNRDRQLTFTAWMRQSGLSQADCGELLQPFAKNPESAKAMAQHYYSDKQQPAIATADIFDWLRPYLPEVPEEIERLVAERTGIEWTAYKNREVIGQKIVPEGHAFASEKYGNSTDSKEIDQTLAATPEAKQWDGWGTGLKPTVEPIVMARKPVKGTIANNVLTYGTGGLNIDSSRIGTNPGYKYRADANGTVFHGQQGHRKLQSSQAKGGEFIESTKGRWPANLIIDEDTAELLDEQSGQVGNGWKKNYGTDDYAGKQYSGGSFGGGGYSGTNTYADSAGASRFFYVAKASKRDRNEGLEELEQSVAGSYSGNVANNGNKIGAQPDKPNQPAKNFHPTVKPTSLMEYLIKLVTPPNGTVLDPFTGSGSTGKAAILQGFDFIGIEMTEEYLPIIEGRLKHAEAKVAERIKETADQEQEKLF